MTVHKRRAEYISLAIASKDWFRESTPINQQQQLAEITIKRYLLVLIDIRTSCSINNQRTFNHPRFQIVWPDLNFFSGFYRLCANIETLEAKCEELQKTVDDLNAQLEITRRRAEKKPEKTSEKPKEKETVTLEPATPNAKKPPNCSTPVKAPIPLPELTKDDEDLLRLSDALRESKVSFAQEHRRVTELEEQLASMVQENNRLQDQLRNWHQTGDEPKSMHEEFSILEEVR